MNLFRPFLAVAAISLVLSACSGDTASIPSSSESSTEVARNATASTTSPVSVENKMEAWWSGDGIPITWKVSEVDPFDFDGVSRPDAAPPNGFQGLEQAAFSGFYKSRLEVNLYAQNLTFVLTPNITIDGQNIDLQPVRFKASAGIPTWFMSTDRISIQCGPDKAEENFIDLMQETPRGLFTYYVVIACNSQGEAELTIKN